MGCGLISQRGAVARASLSSSQGVEAEHRHNGPQQVHGHHQHVRQSDRHGHQQPLASLDPGGGRGSVARVRGAVEDDAEADRGRTDISQMPQNGGSGSAHSEDRAFRSLQHHHGRGGAAGTGGGETPLGRRFIVGERVVLTTRLPGNLQDHAFCFECGAFFQLGSGRSAQCSRCGSTFVQFLRSAGAENWISAESTAGVGYTFENHLDNSISASLAETPTYRRPTQGKFLRNLPALLLSDTEVQVRSNLEAADPKYACAICREAFAVADAVRMLPCNHEFHDGCIVPWLQGNDTCPICRFRMPEATEGEEEDEGRTGEARCLKRQFSGQAEAEAAALRPEGGLAAPTATALGGLSGGSRADVSGDEGGASAAVVGDGGGGGGGGTGGESMVFLEQQDEVAAEGHGAIWDIPPASETSAVVG